MNAEGWIEIVTLLITIFFFPALLALNIAARRRQESQAGALIRRVLRPRLRVLDLIVLSVLGIGTAVGWWEALYSDRTLRESVPLVRITLFWVLALVAILSGPFQWCVEFRENAVLTALYIPWEKIRSYKIVDHRTLHVRMAGYGSLDYRIRPEDMPAVREILEAKLGNSAPAHEIETPALVS